MDTETLIYRSGDLEKFSPAHILQGYRFQLEEIRDLLRFKLDLRILTVSLIDDLEKNLRKILEGISHLQPISQTGSLLKSADAIQTWVEKAINNLYIVSGILQKETTTVREQETRYTKLRECHKFLSQALEYFLI